jgi:hypothetical protein
MADIAYQRTFEHQDWRDEEDVVQAEGESGFNQKFHAIEGELDAISGVVDAVNAEIRKVQRLTFLEAESGVRVPAASASAEFEVEIYDRAALPSNVEKVYFAVLLPITGPKHVQHTFLYSPLPDNKIKVTIIFFNPGAAEARFNFRVLTLAGQT